MENLWKLMPLLLIFGAFMVCMLLIDRKSLNIKSKTVGDGQHGSVATLKLIQCNNAPDTPLTMNTPPC